MALTLNDFQRVKPRNQALIVFGIALGGLALFWYLVLNPLAQENVSRQGTLDALSQQVAVAEARAEFLSQTRAETEELERTLEDLTDILPLERETEEILESVRLAAEEVAMTIVSVVPQATIEREVYSEWPWDFQVQTNYHNLGLFLDRLRSIPRIVNVSRVVMSAQGDGVTTSVSANFTATTFVYREVDELAGETVN